MKVGIFGGSFNPPHIAHVLASAYVLSCRQVDAVWWLPTYKHAFRKQLLPFEQRCQMVEAAIRVFGGMALVCRVEAELTRESRTIDTLNFLEARHPDHEFSLVIGADILLEAHKWKKFDELKQRFPIHVLGRRGYDVPGRTFAVELPRVSSTEIRRRLAANDHQFVAERLPLAVAEIIRRQALYTGNDDGSESSR